MNTAHRRASHAKRQARDPFAIYKVLGRVKGFSEAEQAQLNLPVRLAYDALRNGKAEEGDFHTLAAAVNVAMISAEHISGDGGPMVEHACILARDAMVRVLQRHQRTGKWGFDGPGLAEVLQGVEIYEQLTSLLTGQQLKEAMTECIRRVDAGLTLGGVA
jgi:hypothetical protein